MVPGLCACQQTHNRLGPRLFAMFNHLEFAMYHLLPWWILGAPMVLALLDLMRTPKVRRSER